MGVKIAKISQISNIPEEILSNTSKIELTGNNRIYIENHKGIIFYSEKQIIIRLNKGKIIIDANNIVIKLINEEVIGLEGNIINVKFENME